MIKTIKNFAISPLIVSLFLLISPFSISPAVGAPDSPSKQTMAEPEPSMDNPRKVLVSLNFNDEKSVSSLLYNVINIQKAYGQDNLEIAVLGWGPGVRALLNDSPVKARIESQMQYDIQFIACGNTLDTIGISPDNLIDGVELVKAGLPEIIERELMGWSIIWP
ncbi:MAG: DsrE family protein [Rhodospirillaceae bacterium]|nr:DsrE family protein [Rhodospirillaceae bacterium]